MSELDCDHYRELLAGLIDGELTTEETSDINRHLSRCASCREEYETLREESSKLDSLSFREPPDETLQKFWRLPYSGFARAAGLLLVVGGYLLFLVYGFVTFLQDDGEGFMGKFAIAAIMIGGLIIFCIALIERMITYKTDPYKELER